MALLENSWKMQGLLKIVLRWLWETWRLATIRRAMNGCPFGCRRQGQAPLFALNLQMSDPMFFDVVIEWKARYLTLKFRACAVAVKLSDKQTNEVTGVNGQRWWSTSRLKVAEEKATAAVKLPRAAPQPRLETPPTSKDPQDPDDFSSHFKSAPPSDVLFPHTWAAA